MIVLHLSWLSDGKDNWNYKLELDGAQWKIDFVFLSCDEYQLLTATYNS